MHSYNNIAKFVSAPVGKKFSTTMIMKDGTEFVIKKSGSYKSVANVYFVNDKPANGATDCDMTFNNKSISSSWLRGFDIGKVTHLAFNVELA